VEPALVDLFGDVGKSLFNLLEFIAGDEFLFGEHLGVGDAAGDVVFVEPGVHGDGFDKVDRQSVLRPLDAGLPAFFKFCHGL